MENFERSTKTILELDHLKNKKFLSLTEDNKARGVTGAMSEKIQKAFIITLEMGLKQNLTP